jgi:hypothetical protein
MIKSENINTFVGPEVFKECLAEAMQWYGVYRHGFDQKDLLPTAAYLSTLLLRKAGISKKDGVWICVNRLNKGRGRMRAKAEIEKIAKVDPYECMVDIYCGLGRKDPYKPLITMECEGCAGYSGEVGKSSTADNCDYLWDLFKLLQVSSPLRIFLALCSEKKTGGLQRNIDRHVKAYQGRRNSKDEVYAVVIPWVDLEGKTVIVQRWSGRESIYKKYPMTIGA